MSEATRAPARAPTPFLDLNEVLRVFVNGVCERLAEKFVGAYLQGSFAVGDADANSDCDFIVAITDDLAAAEIASLDELHHAIHDLPYLPWRHRLEGSYVPVDILRRWSLSPRDPPDEVTRSVDWRDPGLSGSGPRVYPFFYLRHGGRRLVRSEHDNTEVVRWSLRERGVVLAGPDPGDLVDPVTSSALRAEMRRTMDLCLAVDLRPLDRVRDQTFWIGLFCRMLHTSAEGIVASKRTALSWAAETVDVRWRDLIERARASRLDGPGAHDTPIKPADVVATRDFALHVSKSLNRYSHGDELASAPDRSRPTSENVSRFAEPGLAVPNDVKLKALARGTEGERWLRTLPELLADISRRWSLTIGKSYPGGSEALVVEARTAEGRAAVLKLAIPGLDPRQGELRTLLVASGRGYAELLAHDADHGAMLLERLGSQLGSLGLTIDDQIGVLCSTLREAWASPPRSAIFATGREKACDMAGFIEATWSNLEPLCSRRTIDVALSFASARAEAFDPDGAVLSHGDAHPGNTLLAGEEPRRRFKFVDPDGLLIEPEYDLGMSMRGWSEQLLAGDPVALGVRRCSLIAELSGADPTAIWHWGFIERVGTGLLLQQIGLHDRARDVLVVADAWAVDDLPWRSCR